MADVRTWFHLDIDGFILWQDEFDSGIDERTWWIQEMMDGAAAAAAPAANILKVSSISWANVKKVSSIAEASVKKVSGVSAGN